MKNQINFISINDKDKAGVNTRRDKLRGFVLHIEYMIPPIRHF
jgi:hypothetical protein